MMLARNNRIGNNPALAAEGVDSVRNEPEVGRTVIEASIRLKLHFPPRFHGVKVDGTNGKMTAFAEKIDFLSALQKHNDPDDPYHLDMHEVVSLGAQFKFQRQCEIRNVYNGTSTYEYRSRYSIGVGSATSI